MAWYLSAHSIDPGVMLWWKMLSIISVFNLVIWGWSAWTCWYRFHKTDPAHYHLRRTHIVLSLVFTLVCGFRSWFPRGDVQRLVLVDHWISSVFLGRSLATIAELCFVAQWAFLIREIARKTNAPYSRMATYWIIPLTATAEIFSWFAVLTTNYLGNTIEESLWTVCFGLISFGALNLVRKARPNFKVILAAGALAGLGYLVFMISVDVPMYLHRFLADSEAGKSYLSFWHGVRDAMHTRHPSGSWSAWESEIPWMSLYFSGAVWISIAAIHFPPTSRSWMKSK